MATHFYTASSLDGFIADSNNGLEWLFVQEIDQKGPMSYGSFFTGIGAMCMGATTYEWVLEHDALLERPLKWADYYGDVPAWVFTHRSPALIPGADLTFVQGDVHPVHEAMVTAANGKNIWIVGGGDLAGAFADAGLLDEIILGVAPVTLGSGAPLLPRRLSSQQLVLTGVAQVGQFAYLTYGVGKLAQLGRHLRAGTLGLEPVNS